jgi:hypothetical protein
LLSHSAIWQAVQSVRGASALRSPQRLLSPACIAPAALTEHVVDALIRQAMRMDKPRAVGRSESVRHVDLQGPFERLVKRNGRQVRGQSLGERVISEPLPISSASAQQTALGRWIDSRWTGTKKKHLAFPLGACSTYQIW